MLKQEEKKAVWCANGASLSRKIHPVLAGADTKPADSC